MLSKRKFSLILGRKLSIGTKTEDTQIQHKTLSDTKSTNLNTSFNRPVRSKLSKRPVTRSKKKMIASDTNFFKAPLALPEKKQNFII